MREIWEKQLFSKLIHQIKEKGLDNPRFFDLLDVNDDNNLSTSEFREGL
jgi:hypothetical protein